MKRIAIIANNAKDVGLINTKHILEYLNGKAELFMEQQYSVLEMGVNYVSNEELFEQAEFMIVLGGDGTILQIAAPCAKRNIPVMGINLGRVGFLTEIELDNIEDALDRLLEDKYDIEKRMLMRIELIKDNALYMSCHALNDVVVSKNANAKLISIELSTGGESVNSYIADGLIIATPTGSTGYSISAGGPVVDPIMDLYVATPICSHSLSMRSAVLPPEKQIVIRLDKEYHDNQAVVSADGDVLGYMNVADEVRITKSKYRFSMLKLGAYSFYNTVLKKLS